MAKVKEVNPVVLKRGVWIGTGNAESDDEFLFDCFVRHAAVDNCLRTSSPTMIISGRTGAGKTAILRYIECEAEHQIALDPFDMAMGYVSNSDALRFLHSIGADLDLLFQVLWKHVLCIEFIRLRWNVENTDKSKSIFERLVERFSREDRRAKSIAYLQEWQGKFWITMDQNIKELTEAVENKLQATVGAELAKFKAGGQYDKRMSSEKKSEIVARTRKIISTDQLAELHGVIDMLSMPEKGDQMKAFYILVDRLDERWVDDTVRFRLIKALMESLRSFRKIQNLKILVALRTDVAERVVQETSDISFQREKFEDFTTRLTWSKADLFALVDSRIAALFKRQYTDKPVGFYDVFPDNVGAKNSFDWMLERTLMRPRDIIAFVNECFDAADGQPKVLVSAMRKAEGEFARKRKDALVQEWRSSYPTLGKVLDFYASQKKLSFALQDISAKEQIEDLALSVCADNKVDFDPLHDMCHSYLDGKKADRFELIQETASVLYRAGALGIKLNAEERFAYSHEDQPLISSKLITPESRVRIHPMLHAAYHMQERPSK